MRHIVARVVLCCCVVVLWLCRVASVECWPRRGQLVEVAALLLLCPAQAAGLKHIGFGPFKRENQDEFFIQVGDFGGVTGGNLFCVFDGHGTHGKDAALYSRQLLPRLLDVELRKYFMVRGLGAWGCATGVGLGF